LVGLFGYAFSATIKNTGVTSVNITGQNNIGALSGIVGATTAVSNCYSTGSVSGNSTVGGLVGQIISGTVSYCYSTGSVSGTSSVGGLVGTNAGSVNNSFWDKETSGRSSSAGGTGKTTAEMKTNSTFINAGWDPSIWYMDAVFNNGYPYLSWQNPGGSPLPVELTSFTAISNGSKVELKWQTATEVNNYGFSVERSEASLNNPESGASCYIWETIGFVQGHGNSNSPKEYFFTDDLNLAFTPNLNYLHYRLKQIDNDGQYKYSDVVEISNIAPSKFQLFQNYPNPFNPSTTISYSIPQTSKVILKVFGVLGTEVTTLVNEEKEAGIYNVEFNSTGLSSGVYFYSLAAGGFNSIRKFVLMK
jgi:hypothetical protein